MSPVRLKTPVDCPNTLEVKLVRLKSKIGNRKDRVCVFRIMVSPLAERRSRSFLHRVATLEFAQDAINVLQMAFVCYVQFSPLFARRFFLQPSLIKAKSEGENLKARKSAGLAVLIFFHRQLPRHADVLRFDRIQVQNNG